MPFTETDVTKRLNDGDEQMFEMLFREYYERLCNYAYSFLNDLDEAEETVQRTFINLWEKRAELSIHTSIKSYLYSAVYHNCLNRIKHLKVREQHRKEVQHTMTREHEEVSEGVLAHELENKIQQVVEELPEKCGLVFRLSRFENLSYAEIAAQLNISYKTVDNHMVKALRILREKLKDYLPLLLWLLFKN